MQFHRVRAHRVLFIEWNSFVTWMVAASHLYAVCTSTLHIRRQGIPHNFFWKQKRAKIADKEVECRMLRLWKRERESKLCFMQFSMLDAVVYFYCTTRHLCLSCRRAYTHTPNLNRMHVSCSCVLVCSSPEEAAPNASFSDRLRVWPYYENILMPMRLIHHTRHTHTHIAHTDE